LGVAGHIVELAGSLMKINVKDVSWAMIMEKEIFQKQNAK
jgi:hypothetical protein